MDAQLAFGFAPAEGGEGHFIGGDWAAHEDRRIPEGAEFGVWHEVGDALVEGAIEDVAEGAFVGRVCGEEDDCAREIGVPQGRCCEQELPGVFVRGGEVV